MKFYTFEIVIEKEPDDVGYFAYSPNVPGCFSNGLTIEEAKRNIRSRCERGLSRKYCVFRSRASDGCRTGGPRRSRAILKSESIPGR